MTETQRQRHRDRDTEIATQPRSLKPATLRRQAEAGTSRQATYKFEVCCHLRVLCDVATDVTKLRGLVATAIVLVPESWPCRIDDQGVMLAYTSRCGTVSQFTTARWQHQRSLETGNAHQNGTPAMNALLRACRLDTHHIYIGRIICNV